MGAFRFAPGRKGVEANWKLLRSGTEDRCLPLPRLGHRTGVLRVLGGAGCALSLFWAAVEIVQDARALEVQRGYAL